MSRAPVIPFDQLPDALKAQVPPRTSRHSSADQSHRVRAGRKLQDDIEATHVVMANRGYGCVYPHARETFGVPGKLMYKKGGNPVDYTGFINLFLHNPDEWRYADQTAYDVGVRIPVVFDAKRLQNGGLYRHDADAIHQIIQLEEAAKNGAAAFLLVHAVSVNRMFCIGPRFFPSLRARTSVRLYDTATDYHPSCSYQLDLGWPYGPLVPLACPGAV